MVTTTHLIHIRSLDGQILQCKAAIREASATLHELRAKLLRLESQQSMAVSAYTVAKTARYYGATDAKGAHIDTTA